MAPRSTFLERFWFGLAAINLLFGIHSFARHGLTDGALSLFVAGGIFACFGAFARHVRRMAEFGARYPGSREGDWVAHVPLWTKMLAVVIGWAALSLAYFYLALLAAAFGLWAVASLRAARTLRAGLSR